MCKIILPLTMTLMLFLQSWGHSLKQNSLFVPVQIRKSTLCIYINNKLWTTNHCCTWINAKQHQIKIHTCNLAIYNMLVQWVACCSQTVHFIDNCKWKHCNLVVYCFVLWYSLLNTFLSSSFSFSISSRTWVWLAFTLARFWLKKEKHTFWDGGNAC